MSRTLLCLILTLTLFSFNAVAEEPSKHDDRVMFDISAEDWVMTKTAHVTVGVEAAVSGSNVGTMRADMMKAVNDLAKTEWRLTSFNRSQDQTGLERWSAMFDARLPESALGGLADSAKRASRAGLQLTVNDIDFSPTLEEMENARALLRTRIYKNSNDQLQALNAALPGRTYRIATIDFSGDGAGTEAAPMPRIVRGQLAPMMATANVAPSGQSSPTERAEKIMLTAHVVFAATAPSDTKRPTP